METLTGSEKCTSADGSGIERGRERESGEERASFLFGSALKIHDVEDVDRAGESAERAGNHPLVLQI